MQNDSNKQSVQSLHGMKQVAQTTLKEKLETKIQKHTKKIADFATDQEQPLVSLRDGYEEHARGMQVKLLARFHVDLAQ